MNEAISNALFGGALIGLAASALLFFFGRIAGISGIVGGLFLGVDDDKRWRKTFLSGLLFGGMLLSLLTPSNLSAPMGRSLPALAIAGLLVGFGVRMCNGCTSGHGVCGVSRLSKRSFVATLTFMSTGIITATAIRIGGGGVL